MHFPVHHGELSGFGHTIAFYAQWFASADAFHTTHDRFWGDCGLGLADVSDEAYVVVVALSAFGVGPVFGFGVKADRSRTVEVGA